MRHDVSPTYILACAYDENGGHRLVREHSDHHSGKTRRHRGSARGDAARLSWACLRVLGARSRRGFYFRERGGKPSIERRNRDLSNDLRTDCTTTLAVAERVRCIPGMAHDHVGAQRFSLDCIPSIRSQSGCFRVLLLHCEAVLSRQRRRRPGTTWS